MNRKQAKKLMHRIATGPGPITQETQERWSMLVVDALLGTGGDEEFEYLERRFSKKLPAPPYRTGLGGCTAPLAAAT